MVGRGAKAWETPFLSVELVYLGCHGYTKPQTGEEQNETSQPTKQTNGFPEQLEILWAWADLTFIDFCLGDSFIQLFRELRKGEGFAPHL